MSKNFGGAAATRNTRQDEDFQILRQCTPSRKKMKPKANVQAIITEREHSKQLRGFHKTKEVALVVEQSVCESDIGQLIREGLSAVESGSVCSIFPQKSSIPGLCRWTHRPYLKGGAGNVLDEDVIVLPFAVVLFDLDHLVSLLQLDNSCRGSKIGDDCLEFRRLANHIEDNIKTRLSGEEKCPDNTQLAIVLVDVDKYVVNNRNEVRNLPEILVTCHLNAHFISGSRYSRCHRRHHRVLAL